MGLPAFSESQLPERDIERLARRLNRQWLWNGLLAVVPPLLFVAYAATLLFVIDRVGFDVLVFSWAAIFGVALAMVLRFQTTMPDHREVARLLDKQSDGKEHFLTLATMHRLRPRPWVAAKLRAQALQLLHRVNFRRDFPYRLKRGSVLSLVLSAAAILILHLVLEKPGLSLKGRVDLAKVQQLAARLSRESGLEKLALGAQQAAGDLRAKIRGTPMVQKVMEQLEAQLGSGSQDGQQSGAGGGSSTKKSERSKGGREQKNAAGTEQAPGDGTGEGDSGEAPGTQQDGMAQSSSGDHGESRPAGKGSQGEKATGAGGAGEKDDSRRSAETGDQRDQGAREGGRPGGSGEPNEAIPKGTEPDRFNPPGTGAEGIEGSRFVTVALPKTLARGGGQEAVGEQQDGGSNATVPVSNLPLPPRDDPAAAGEKQHMPIEYQRLFE